MTRQPTKAASTFNSVHELANLKIVRTGTVTIATDAFLSNALEVGRLTPIRVNMPAAWSAANLTLQGSDDDGTTYRNVYNTGGEYTITAAASRAIVLDPNDLVGFTHIKIRSGTAASTVGQAAARTVEIAYRLV